MKKDITLKKNMYTTQRVDDMIDENRSNVIDIESEDYADLKKSSGQGEHRKYRGKFVFRRTQPRRTTPLTPSELNDEAIYNLYLEKLNRLQLSYRERLELFTVAFKQKYKSRMVNVDSLGDGNIIEIDDIDFRHELTEAPIKAEQRNDKIRRWEEYFRDNPNKF